MTYVHASYKQAGLLGSLDWLITVGTEDLRFIADANTSLATQAMLFKTAHERADALVIIAMFEALQRAVKEQEEMADLKRAINRLDDAFNDRCEALIRTSEHLDAARSQVLDLTSEHETYKAQVRSMAIVKAAELGWCDEGLNEALEELGLERKYNTYEVDLEVILTQRITVTVSASDADHAKNLAEEHDAVQRQLQRDFEANAYSEGDLQAYDNYSWTISDVNVKST